MYSREIDGQVLTLSASGWTVKNTFVLFDFETKSLWYHFEWYDGLVCVGGQYADRKLPELPAKLIRFNAWYQDHPDTKFMACKRTHAFGCAGY